MVRPSHTIRLRQGHYFGTVARAISAGQVHLTDVKYAPGVRVPRHSHDRPFLCIVSSGAFIERSGSRHIECGPGSVVWHPAGEQHGEEFASVGAGCMNVELDPNWVDRFDSSRTLIDSWLSVRGGDAAWLAARIQEEARRQDSLSALAIEGCLSALLATLARTSDDGQRRPWWIDRHVSRLREDLLNVPTLDELAAEAGAVDKDLARTFHRHIGFSIGEYVRRLRVEWACDEISRSPDEALSTIAIAAGFADQAHFTRVFSRVTGTTPRQYRLRHR